MSRARASAGRRPGVARLQPSRRADQAALLAPRRYRDLAPSATPAQRQQLRRTAYHQLADARRAAAQAHAEPNRARCSLLDWEGTVTAAEQLCDAVTLSSLPGPGSQSGHNDDLHGVAPQADPGGEALEEQRPHGWRCSREGRQVGAGRVESPCTCHTTGDGNTTRLYTCRCPSTHRQNPPDSP